MSLKFEDLQFMSIGGNCLGLYILGGQDRIKGPVDNVVIEKANAIKLLLDNKYFEAIKTEPCTQIPTPHPHKGEPVFSSQFDFGVTVIHNDPKTERYLETLSARVKTFNSFLNELKNKPNYYFVFALNQRTTFYNTKTLRGTVLQDLLELFQHENLLDKVIFVGTNQASAVTENWTFYSYALNEADKQKFKTEFNFNYIELDNLDLRTLSGQLAAYTQFKSKVIDYLNKEYENE